VVQAIYVLYNILVIFREINDLLAAGDNFEEPYNNKNRDILGIRQGIRQGYHIIRME
jgi:hypothetical protein